MNCSLERLRPFVSSFGQFGDWYSVELQRLMSARSLPPILVVLGATGSGKTKLGVELARMVGGEVVNVDSMQLYRGLPIATNQASAAERAGVRHHLLGFLDPTTEKHFTVRRFRDMALPLISELRAAGTSPVLVGGTTYYLEALLWDFILQEEDEEEGEKAGEVEEWAEVSNAQLHAMLTSEDPVWARRLHPNDRRKVLNALRISRKSGRPYSDLLQEQLQGEGLVSGPRRFPPGEVIAFFVDTKKSLLDARLNRRVEQMLEQGLLDEIRTFWDYGGGEAGRGLWQSIGLKEFRSFLTLSTEEQTSESGQQVFAQAVSQLKLSTRQYARRQLKWIRNRLLRRPPAHALALFRCDTSNPERWTENVSDRASQVLNFHNARRAELQEVCADDLDFFRDCPVPHMPLVPITPSEVVSRRCEVCDGRLFVSEKEWTIHLRSRRHERRLQSLRRKAEREGRDCGDGERKKAKLEGTKEEVEQESQNNTNDESDGAEKSE